MAAVVKHSGGVSLASLEPPAGDRLTGQAGVAIAAGDLCYLASDGFIKLSIATADNAAALVDGIASRGVPAGNDITLFRGDQRMNYAEGTLTPGKRYYLSGTVAGGLVDTPALAGDWPVCFAKTTERIQLLPFRPDLVSVLRAV